MKSLSFLFYDGNRLGGTHFDRPLDVLANVVGWFRVEDLDDTALRHREHIGGLQFAHGVALAQILVEEYAVAAHGAATPPFPGRCAPARRRAACGSAPWRAGPTARPSWS